MNVHRDSSLLVVFAEKKENCIVRESNPRRVEWALLQQCINGNFDTRAS